MPQCALASGPSFLPVPSALVTFRSPGGERQVQSVGWLGVVCGTPALLTVCLRSGAGDRELIPAGHLFFVNLPNEELLQVLAGRMWPGRETDLATSAGTSWPFLAGEERGVPMVAACPVRIECRCRSLRVRFGQYRLCGEVLAVHIDGHRREIAAPVDFCRLAPFQRRRFQGRGVALEQRKVSVS